jgi:hypothetical protein
MAGISVARGKTVVTSNRRLAGKMGCGGDVVFPGLELELQALSSRVRQDNHLAFGEAAILQLHLRRV